MIAAHGIGIILAIIRGFTEFFPISFSGHLVIFQELFRMRGHDNRFAHSLIPAGIAAFLYFRFWFGGLRSF